MEGILGAVECALFRESVQEAALRSKSRFGGICLAVPFERGRYRTAAGVGPLSGTGRHGIATEGVRVSQVGVNPSRRAVVVGGVEKAEARATPGLRQLGWRCLARGVTTCFAAACRRNEKWGFGSSWACSGNALL